MSTVYNIFDLDSYLAHKLKNATLTILTIVDWNNNEVVCEDNEMEDETHKVSFNDLYDTLGFNSLYDALINSIQEQLEEDWGGEPTFTDCMLHLIKTHPTEASELASLTWWRLYHKDRFLGKPC